MSARVVLRGYVERLAGMTAPIDGLGMIFRLEADLARDMAEQVFTLCCARADMTDADLDGIFDRAAAAMVGNMRDLFGRCGLDTLAHLERAEAVILEAFTARLDELCAAGQGGDHVQ